MSRIGSDAVAYYLWLYTRTEKLNNVIVARSKLKHHDGNIKCLHLRQTVGLFLSAEKLVRVVHVGAEHLSL